MHSVSSSRLLWHHMCLGRKQRLSWRCCEMPWSKRCTGRIPFSLNASNCQLLKLFWANCFSIRKKTPTDSKTKKKSWETLGSMLCWQHYFNKVALRRLRHAAHKRRQGLSRLEMLLRSGVTRKNGGKIFQHFFQPFQWKCSDRNQTKTFM
jgi:hypothetical protein